MLTWQMHLHQCHVTLQLLHSIATNNNALNLKVTSFVCQAQLLLKPLWAGHPLPVTPEALLTTPPPPVWPAQ